MEMTEQQINDLKAKATGLEAALREERENRKASQKQLDEIQEKLNNYVQIEEKEKEKKKKEAWKYEELLKQKDEQIKQLEEKAVSFDKIQSERQELIEKKLADLTSKMPETFQEGYGDILESLDGEKKVKFMEKFITDTKVEDFGKRPVQWKQMSGFEKLTIEAFRKLAPANRKEYMSNSLETLWEVSFSQE